MKTRFLHALAAATLLAIPIGTWTGAAARPAGNEHAFEASDPWSASETIQPADLAKELAGSKGAKPAIVCAGFRSLYEGAHNPGAVFDGPARSPEGLAALKSWAKGVPRDAEIVVYCGCCPLSHCPNIRPAFQALRLMGFARIRVLLLPNDFATDWVAKGYPVAKGK